MLSRARMTPASAAATYNTPLTTLRGAGRMPDCEDGTSGSDDDVNGSPSVRGQGPLRGCIRGRRRGGGRSRRGRGAAGVRGGATDHLSAVHAGLRILDWNRSMRSVTATCLTAGSWGTEREGSVYSVRFQSALLV
jgi:hypothetical protein